MAEIPENKVTEKDLAEWYKLDQQIRELKIKELLLRNKIYTGLFVKKNEDGGEILPPEGTNKHRLPDGYELKVQRVINRTPDEATLQALKKERNDLLERTVTENLTDQEIDRLEVLRRIPFDDLIRYKPELAVKAYRELTEEERQVFDQALVIKDGTPQMEIVLPKRRT